MIYKIKEYEEQFFVISAVQTLNIVVFSLVQLIHYRAMNTLKKG